MSDESDSGFRIISPSAGPNATSSSPDFPATLSTDIILRSSDEVDFHCQKNILAVHSSFFANMFDTVQSSRSRTSVPTSVDSSIVPMPEKAAELKAFLRWIHPTLTGPPRIASADQLGEAVTALVLADKYDVPSLPGRMEEVLTNLLLGLDVGVTAFRIYCIASHFRLPHCARNAAPRALSTPLFELLMRVHPESAIVAVADIAPFVEYHHRCCEAAAAVFTCHSFCDDNPLSFMRTFDLKFENPCISSQCGAEQVWEPSKWRAQDGRCALCNDNRRWTKLWMSEVLIECRIFYAHKVDTEMHDLDVFLKGERFQYLIRVSSGRCEKCKGGTSLRNILNPQGALKATVKAAISGVELRLPWDAETETPQT